MYGEVSFQPRRELGRTGFRATQLGIGDLADRSIPIGECVATIHRAMDYGLNVIDTAPSYEDGYSEEIVCQALHGRREGMFLIDKIDHHDRPVMQQVEKSLLALGVENADLLVFHGLSTLEGWRNIVRPGGGMEELGTAVAQGKCRFRGISSHHPEVLREAIVSGLCDAVMFPIGPYVDLRYVEEILPLARKEKVATICFKSFGAGKLLGDTSGYNRPLQQRPRGKVSSGGEEGGVNLLPRLSVDECLHYTLTCDPDVALLGMSFPNEVDAAVESARRFEGPMTAERMAEVRRAAERAMEGKGGCWWNPPE